MQTSFIEELSGVATGKRDVLRDGTQEFDDMRQMVIISRVFFRRMRFEEIVSGGQLKCHASRRPDVCRRAIAGAQYYFQTPVLTSLNVFSEVMIL